MINVLDLAQICLAFFLIRRVIKNLQWWGYVRGCEGGAPRHRRQLANWGCGAKSPAAGSTGVWGRSPQCLNILYFLGKNNLILGLF